MCTLATPGRFLAPQIFITPRIHCRNTLCMLVSLPCNTCPQFDRSQKERCHSDGEENEDVLNLGRMGSSRMSRSPLRAQDIAPFTLSPTTKGKANPTTSGGMNWPPNQKRYLYFETGPPLQHRTNPTEEIKRHPKRQARMCPRDKKVSVKKIRRKGSGRARAHTIDVR